MTYMSIILHKFQILELMRNPRLQNLLYMVLVAGNFLNSVSYFFYRPVIILWIVESKWNKTFDLANKSYFQLDDST